MSAIDRLVEQIGVSRRRMRASLPILLEAEATDFSLWHPDACPSHRAFELAEPSLLQEPVQCRSERELSTISFDTFRRLSLLHQSSTSEDHCGVSKAHISCIRDMLCLALERRMLSCQHTLRTQKCALEPGAANCPALSEKPFLISIEYIRSNVSKRSNLNAKDAQKDTHWRNERRAHPTSPRLQ